MQLVFHHMPGHPLATAAVVVHVGWRHEPPSLRGISHFSEHAHYLGSVRYPNVERETAQYGTEIDGPTLAEATVFSFVSLKEDFPHILPVLLDMVYYPRFEQEAVERERKGVMGATCSDADFTPWEWVRLKADDLVFQTDELTSLGTEKTLQSIRLEDLREWQQRYYHAANSLLLVAGDVEMSAVREVLAEADIPSTGEEPAIRRHERKRRFYHESREIAHPELYVAFRFAPPGHLLPHELLAILLGNHANSRLFRRLKQEDPVAYMVESEIRLLSDVGRFGIYVGIAEVEDAEKGWAALVDLLATLREEEFSKGDLAWAKRVYKLQLCQNATDPQRALASLAKQVTRDRPPPDFASLGVCLMDIGPGQVQQLCRELFRPENCCIALVGPSEPPDTERWWGKFA